jgi:hypothetical protein
MVRTIRSEGAIDSSATAEVLDAPVIEVRRIEGEAELDAVYRLTHDCFVERGYCPPQPGARLIHHPHLDRIPETTILVAVVDGEIVGTNSWTLDGPAGLHVDKDFKRETDAIRAEGRVLASSWRIATRSGYRHDRHVVIGLIRETIRQFADVGGQTSVFTFNPRHERIYERLLNMTTVARRPDCCDFASPLVFMRMDMEKVPAYWFK